MRLTTGSEMNSSGISGSPSSVTETSGVVSGSGMGRGGAFSSVALFADSSAGGVDLAASSGAYIASAASVTRPDALR